METITQDYLVRAELSLLISLLLYFVMNGAGIFETVVLIPKWSSHPPDSFQVFKKPYGINLKSFWIVMHSIHEFSFILAIVVCWKLEEIRNCLLILFGIHFLLRVWTLAYFAPNIMEFERIANSTQKEPNLAKRVNRWRNLNYIRTGLFIAISIALIPLYIKLIHFKI